MILILVANTLEKIQLSGVILAIQITCDPDYSS